MDTLLREQDAAMARLDAVLAELRKPLPRPDDDPRAQRAMTRLWAGRKGEA